MSALARARQVCPAFLGVRLGSWAKRDPPWDPRTPRHFLGRYGKGNLPLRTHKKTKKNELKTLVFCVFLGVDFVFWYLANAESGEGLN